MRPYARTAAIALALLTSVSIGEDAPSASGKVKAYGVFRVDSEEKTEHVDGTPSGIRRTAEQAWVAEKGEKIRAKLGLRFGIEYSLAGLPKDQDVTIRKVVIHPTIKTPDGRERTTYQTEVKRHTSKDGTFSAQTGYGFDHDYELVAGTWTIQMWYGERKLVEQRFDVRLAE